MPASVICWTLAALSAVSSFAAVAPGTVPTRAPARAAPSMLGEKVEIAFSNGRTVLAVSGQKLSDVARAAGSKISYNCKNGDCGTCTVKLNGRAVRTCVARVPAGGPFKVQVDELEGSAGALKAKSLQDQLKEENAGKKKGFFGF